MVRAPANRQRGGVLLSAAIVLLIVGMALLASHLIQAQERNLTQSTAPVVLLTELDAALAAFVSQHKRLPCPARGAFASTTAKAGVESINPITGQCNPNTQDDGVVPWVTLGLSEAAALDPWQGRITYRVQPSLASNLLLLMNMSWCDPAGMPSGAPSSTLPCTAPCSGAACRHPNSYLYSKGLAVRDGSGAWRSQPSPPWPGAPGGLPPLATGAAYVLVSHGANGVGAYNANGLLQGGTSSPGTNELSNRNGQALIGATVFIDAVPSVAAGTAHFDDLLRHPSLATVLERAALAPRTPH